MASQPDIIQKIEEATKVYAEIRRCKEMEDGCFKWFEGLFKRYGNNVVVDEILEGDKKKMKEEVEGLMVDVYRRRDLCEWVNSNTEGVEVKGGVEEIFKEMGLEVEEVGGYFVEEEEEDEEEREEDEIDKGRETEGHGREEEKIKEVLERTIKAIQNQCPFEIIES
ncbi:hypothetical protein TrST_g13253 [Triparma strigata]|uniref:Uncharacterized protein n=1 Tax=Triparma strigata TaxID=1606541 RepID=A0A9W7ANN8_9STRA|nr:hypothetical protein TrST_g13253 [Triparma strigata]